MTLKKKTCLGCFKIKEERDKDNATGLKDGGVIEMSTTVLSIYAMHALFRFLYFTYPQLFEEDENNKFKNGKYSKRKRACIAYMESTVVDISIPPSPFKPVSLYLSRSSLF